MWIASHIGERYALPPPLVTGVAEAAQNTTRGTQDTQKAAAELARMATSLRNLATFKA